MSKPNKIGITGGIGVGKTHICKIFERFSIPIYYSDHRAKILTNSHPDIIGAIKTLFGEEIYKNCELDRPKMASIVFKDIEKLNALNAIIHPIVEQDFQSFLIEKKHYPYILKESALLIETKNYQQMDGVILITAPLQIRISRVMQRDRESSENILMRIKNQMPDEDKIPFANWVIQNSQDSDLYEIVEKIHWEIMSMPA